LPYIERINPQLAKRLSKIVKGNYTYERVETVKVIKGKRTVYDVTVPKGHAFIANGLVSHNTTTATMTMVEAVKANVPMVQIWDFERSFDARYAVNMSNNDGSLTRESFGRKNADGSWKVRPRVPSYVVDTAEEFFDALHHTFLHKLIKKQKRIDLSMLLSTKRG
jgi:hypothetical protein